MLAKNLMKMLWLLSGWDWFLVVGRELPNRGSSEKAGEWGSCVQTIVSSQAHRQAPQVNQWGNARPTEDWKGRVGGGGGGAQKYPEAESELECFIMLMLKVFWIKKYSWEKSTDNLEPTFYTSHFWACEGDILRSKLYLFIENYFLNEIVYQYKEYKQFCNENNVCVKLICNKTHLCFVFYLI